MSRVVRRVDPLPRAGFCLLLLLATTGWQSAVEARDGLDQDQRARLDRGEVIVSTRELPGEEVPEVRVLGVVNAPPKEVWKAVDRCGDYKEFLPRVVESAQLERDEERVICSLRIDLPFPFGELWYENEALHKALPGHRFLRRWRLIKGSYEKNHGAWELCPWGKDGRKTLVDYHFVAIPDLFIPTSLQMSIQKRGLPGVIKALSKRVKELRGRAGTGH